MAKQNDYWTSPRVDGTWTVKRAGSDRASSIHGTQEEAWKEAKRLARGAGTEAFLKDGDGRIRMRNAYGDDPNSSAG